METGLSATRLPFLIVRDVVGALLRFRPRLLDDASTCSSSVKESSSSVAGGRQAVPAINLSLFN